MAQTEYDLADRPCQTELRDGSGNVLYRTGLKYDKLNNLKQFSERVGSEAHTSDYTYDRDNRVTQIAYDGTTHKVGYAYDELGRVTSRTVENGVANAKLTSAYTYAAGGYGTNSTTPLVAKITQSTPAGAAMNFEYTYDSRGNIASEKRGSLTTTYAYDALGQLVRVNDPNDTASGSSGTTWVYNYDRGGNILSKVRYAYTTGTPGTALQTIPYTYGDSNWKDKLTAYNGQTITYDAIGNPLSDGTWTYTWGAGRQLRQMSKAGMTVQFRYDHNGLRTQKIVTENGVTTTTNYVLHGKMITHMTCGSDTLHFFYDVQSRPAKVRFNGVMYTYVHNLQGDIVAILDSNGVEVVEYRYDAWGKLLSATGTLKATLGKLNPFRYRGYIYDEELRMYWAESRYYYPELHRFICADDVTYLSAHNSLKNAFAYCNLRPINLKDPTGYIPEDAANELIRENAQFIIDAAEEFDVDPQILAGVIYTEQVLNVNWIDTCTDWLGCTGIIDTTIGISQVRMSTAKSVEDDGLIERTTIQYNKLGVIATEHQLRWSKLCDNKTNIRYAAAYLKQLTNAWQNTYSKIAKSPSILGTLYNIGVGKPHGDPKPNRFGTYVANVYNKMKELLGMK